MRVFLYICARERNFNLIIGVLQMALNLKNCYWMEMHIGYSFKCIKPSVDPAVVVLFLWSRLVVDPIVVCFWVVNKEQKYGYDMIGGIISLL